MKKTLLSVAVIGALCSNAFAADESDLTSQIQTLTKKVEKLEKKQKKNTKNISKVNKLANNDNLKFHVDFRTSYDNLNYKTASGKEYKNDALLSNRLWLNMAYAPTNNLTFHGQLAFNKAFGASYGQRATGQGYDTFDWIVNEALTDDTIKLREAYWLWKPTLGGREYAFSLGRRPSTNGFLANLREDDQAKSPLGHVINMEFDGASAAVKLDDVLPGMYFKICLGRGVTNAESWANSTGMNYIKDTDNIDTSDFAGFIFVPYDDGQYSVETTWYRGFHVPGMTLTDMDFSTSTQTWAMETTGNMDGMAISAKTDGVGDGISDFLDDTILFASYAVTISHPNDNILRTASADTAAAYSSITGNMLGSNESKTGNSIWVGAQMPNMTGGRFGLEYNHGSKYWRPFTYGEDTMIGSKLAARGNAYEAYWTQPIVKKGDQEILSMQVRYTYIKYDYTGSNGFFGDGGTPYTMAEATALGLDPVEKAQDIRVYFRYRY